MRFPSLGAFGSSLEGILDTFIGFPSFEFIGRNFRYSHEIAHFVCILKFIGRNSRYIHL